MLRKLFGERHTAGTQASPARPALPPFKQATRRGNEAFT
jgi:hypothetical protein